jgi:peptidase inhibitor I9
VVVRAIDRAGAETLVERLADRVVRPLPIVRGFAARLPAAHLRALKRSPLVASVTRDVRVSLVGAAGAEGTSPLGVIADQIGVAELWARDRPAPGWRGFRPS